MDGKVRIKNLPELSAEVEAAKETFLTAEIFKGIEFPELEAWPKLEAEGERRVNPATSSFVADDPLRITYLIQLGVNVPKQWYIIKDENAPLAVDRYGADRNYHAEIVTAAIFASSYLRDIADLIHRGVAGQDLESELQYHTDKLFENRLSINGDREPDITGRFRNREERRIANGSSVNPKGQVSLAELATIRDMVLTAFRKP